jgi:hypothetical protein
MRRKKLYKNCMIEFLFTCSDAFYYTQNKQLTRQCDSPSCWKSWKTFALRISRLQKMTKYWISFKKMCHRKLYKTSIDRSYSESEKSLKYFQYDGKRHCHVSCSFWTLKEIIRTGKMECDRTAYVKLFTAHLLGKKIKALSFT